MFRRRPLRPRRPFFRRRRPLPPPGVPPPARPLPPRIQEALARANRLMAEGQFGEAAGIFDQLSEKARQHGLAARAAELTLQASRAYFAAGDVDVALERAKRGLQLLIENGRVGRVSLLLSKMTAALRGKGYDAQADELERWVEQALEEMGLSLEEARQHAPQMPEKRGSLPTSCSGCGAPLVPDEVEWHDAQTAGCPYCGTVAKTT